MPIYLLVFTVTLLAAAALVITQKWHGRFSLDTAGGIQNHHTEPTPRVGGIAILLGLVSAWLLASKEVRHLLGPMLLAGVPAFVFGLMEDVTKRVSIRARLLATMASGALAWYLTGIAMQNAGVPPLDWLLQLTPLAVLFTAFAVGGLANAINIIDGFNGLATGAVAIMFGALGLMASNLADYTLANVCYLMAVCSLGFGAVNWPLGKIFLGDGGAYLLGFVLAWLAVLVPMRNPNVNGIASAMVCLYPVLEVAFSVRRRRHRTGHHPGQADKAHLHHFIHRRIICQLFPKLDDKLKNGLTSPLCWLGTALPAGWAIVFAQDTPMLIVGLALFILAYAAVYARLTQFRWCFSPLTLRASPEVSST